MKRKKDWSSAVFVFSSSSSNIRHSRHNFDSFVTWPFCHVTLLSRDKSLLRLCRSRRDSDEKDQKNQSVHLHHHHHHHHHHYVLRQEQPPSYRWHHFHFRWLKIKSYRQPSKIKVMTFLTLFVQCPSGNNVTWWQKFRWFKSFSNNKSCLESWCYHNDICHIRFGLFLFWIWKWRWVLINYA